MKKGFLVLALIGVSLSSLVYAQSFDGGGYIGPSLEPIGIADLQDTAANEYVILGGTIAQQRVPGRYVLVNGEGAEQVSVVVRIGPYEWVNLEVDNTTPVVIYGIVLKSDSSIEILAERIGFPGE